MNLNITQKLMVGFLVVILFSVTVGTFAYVSLLQVTRELQGITLNLDPAISRDKGIIRKAHQLIAMATRYKAILFAFTMISFIVTLGVSLFLANKFTDPIIYLSKKAELIGRGQLTERIDFGNSDCGGSTCSSRALQPSEQHTMATSEPYSTATAYHGNEWFPFGFHSGDEIGELARTFNQMAASLQDRQIEVERVNQELQDRQIEVERVNQELERRGQVLCEANAKLERLNAVKSDFLSTVSHELRTPLTVIKGYISLIKNRRLGPVNEQQLKGLTIADERADHLNSLISDLLDLSRIEFDKYEIRLEVLDFAALAKMSADSMLPLFKKKGVRFKTCIPAGLPHVYADKQKVSQVLTNLLSNAIKFTPVQGEVILEALPDVEEGACSALESVNRDPLCEMRDAIPSLPVPFCKVSTVNGQRSTVNGQRSTVNGTSISQQIPPSMSNWPAQNFIQVNVRDTGIGLAEDEADRIFDKFYQVDNSITREYGGTGLGLCIARNIVDLHHGRMWVKSKEGEGSVFSFALPKATESCRAAGAQPPLTKPVCSSPSIEEQGTGKEGMSSRISQILKNAPERKILVVDNNPITRELIITCISKGASISQNWKIFTAHDGIEALEKILQDTLDLILLDINLPRLNGYDLCQIVKTNEKTKNIPLIILSASAQRSEIDRGFRMGANDYITHPFVPEEIVKKIGSLIG